MNNPIKAVADKVRNLFNIATFKKRDGKEITVETDFCRTLEGQEMFPYGFFSKAQEGKVIVLSQGGNAGSFVFLPVCSTDGAPELEEGDACLWTKDGAFVIARGSGTLELNGTDYSGLVKADELKTQLDKMTARIDGIINAIQTAAVAPTDGGATFKANMIAVLATLQNKEDFSQIKNEAVQHGKG